MIFRGSISSLGFGVQSAEFDARSLGVWVLHWQKGSDWHKDLEATSGTWC